MKQSYEQPAQAPSHEETIQRLKAILETTVDAIITIDDNGRIESLNHSAEQMFGYKAWQLIGHNVSMLMPIEEASRHDQYLRGYVSTGAPRVIGRTREITACRSDGTTFPIEIALSSTEVDGRRIFTSVIRDISRRRATEEELQRYRTHLEQMVAQRTTDLEAANEYLEKTQSELIRANAQLETIARVDALTGIGNRRAFDERLTLEWRRRQRDAGHLSVIICDIDHFKLYNDHCGHPAGDHCLRQVADAINTCFQRATDFAARYGGEEFAVVLAKVKLAAATERAEAVRKAVHALAIDHPGLGAGHQVTVSVGVASCIPSDGTDPLAFIEAVDAALYRAKENGRDRVEVAQIQSVALHV